MEEWDEVGYMKHSQRTNHAHKMGGGFLSYCSAVLFLTLIKNKTVKCINVNVTVILLF